MSTPAISFEHVALSLGQTPIYRDIGFEVATGEFVCLVGASGCGKSTALRLVGDLLNVQAGTVEVAGRLPDEAWQKTAFVFQSPRLLPWKSVLENAAFGIEMRFPGVSKQERLARARRELESVGLGDDLAKVPSVLSGGEKQRVAIARALALDPEILLMDEPFSALDHSTRSRLRLQLLDLWRERRTTILFVTHDIDEALYLADRIIVLSRKPTVVADIVEIDAPRPRVPETDPDLTELRHRLIALLAQAEDELAIT